MEQYLVLIPNEMAQVSGVDMFTKLKGTKVKKGDEFGKFKFGGTDTILLFQNNPDVYLWKNDPAHSPISFPVWASCRILESRGLIANTI